ncbi:MAG: efflux RND transporter periplasmic adaptor subunit [Flavobacteriaceae bacterium]|nr:efflux RND transporter periplasmic adaptor subunit [Flavobacteriaceae bacterium]
MKKSMIILSFSLLLLACSQEKGGTNSVNQATTNLEELQNKKASYTSQISALNQELKQVNEAILSLTGDEKRTLVTAFQAESKVFNHTVEVQANIKTRQNLLLSPEFSGRLEQILVVEGQNVKKGKLLAVIDDAGLQDQLDQMNLQLALSKTNFERTERLWNQKIGSEMMYLEAKTRYNTQQKQVAQMKEQLAKTKIYAPFDGVIDEIAAREGETVAPGMSPILRIVNLNSMYVESDVPENYLKNITKGSKATAIIPVLNETQNTIIRQTGNFIQPSNRTFRIEAPIDNPTGLIKPNLNARLSVIDYANPEAIMIPLRVVRENAKGETFVFVLETPEEDNGFTTSQQFVTLGKAQNEMVEIIQGIEPNALIVDEGVSLLVAGQKVTRIEQ